jgi:hypothetical protein
MRWFSRDESESASKPLIRTTNIRQFSMHNAVAGQPSVGRECGCSLPEKWRLPILFRPQKLTAARFPVDKIWEMTTLHAMIRTANIARWYFTLLP